MMTNLPPEELPTPQQLHDLEQKWAAADERVTAYIKEIQDVFVKIAKVAGTSDDSLMFDLIKHRLYAMAAQHGFTHETLQLMGTIAAAAFTRLARTPRAEQDDILAQLEKDV